MHPRSRSSYAASDESLPQPHVFVIPTDNYGHKRPEYWIVDHGARVVEVYRDAVDGRWRSLTTHEVGDSIAMLQFPHVRIAVADILPPAEAASATELADT